ncbi:hypothetical protein ACFE04_010404 [Oxalis oulophora]
MAKPMPPLFYLTFTMFLALTFQSTPSHSSASIDSFVFGGCTQQRYTSNSPYESNVNSLLTSLVNSATYSSYNNFTIFGSTPQDSLYGLYQCRGDLAMPDCATCIARAISQFGTVCPNTCGGAVQLQGCYVKYDNATFLGLEDKTVVLKKCEPSSGDDTETIDGRDAMLQSLMRAGGPFRIGGTGNVMGVAQCVGDLSMSECQDCLSTAIERLQSDCGTAVIGDMFLAKCYARYSTNGAQAVYAKAHNGN